MVMCQGSLLLGASLTPGDSAYLLLLFALFIPAGEVLFIVKKLRKFSST